MTTATTPPAASAPVRGRNLRPGALADQFGPEPTLLVFLRHLGCVFCRESVRDLRRETDGTPGRRVVFVHQGTVAEGDAVIGRLWPGAPAVADPEGVLYDAYGVERGGAARLFGPRTVACALRAVARGNMVGVPAGDVRTLPTAFLVDGGRVVWEHRGAHAGDLPHWPGPGPSVIPGRPPGRPR